MKKKWLSLFSFIFTLTFILAFSCGVLATEESNYADEGDDDSSSGISTLSVSPETTTTATDGNLIVVLDPGHGGSDPGAGSGSINEKTINLKVAQYCQAYLQQNYSGKVTVYLTRTGDTALSRPERAEIAASYGADLLISIHFNSNDSSSPYGGEVYVSSLDEYALTDLGTQIVNNLGNLGIKKRGVFTRDSEDGTYWTDGARLADYYGIIKYPAYYDIPAMIIEHCFLSNSSDLANYASSDTKLKALGEADAQAIATYFNLGENINSTTLANAKYTATTKLNNYYNALSLSAYTATYQTKIQSIYQDALNRINLATGTGKINLTVSRAIKTIAYYPTTVAKFSDVKALAWYKNAVVYNVVNGLFYGTSDTTFSPNESITRGMFISVIGRSNGVSGTTPATTVFSDVTSTAYYAPYIAWASQNDIVAGITATTYGPNQAITREDLVTMLYRYATVEGITLSGASGKTVANFNDAANIDSWAQDAMAWAVEHGVINGDDLGNLNPRSNTTRAEAAQIIMGFDQQSN